jgi:hypothetical protein
MTDATLGFCFSKLLGEIRALEGFGVFAFPNVVVALRVKLQDALAFFLQLGGKPTFCEIHMS